MSNYSINPTIENVVVLPNTAGKFKNQIYKVEINCNISVEGIDEIFTLPIVKILPNPIGNDSYLDIDNISKDQIISWGLSGCDNMIKAVVARKINLKNIQNSLNSETLSQEPEAPIILSASDFYNFPRPLDRGDMMPYDMGVINKTTK